MDLASPTPSRRRNLSFRLASVILLPLLLLLTVEVSLRLAGTGYPTAFLIRDRINNTDVVRDNPRYGWRFFTPQRSRAPWPIVCERPKPAHTTRIVVLGGSAAAGDPEPAFSFGRILETMLAKRFPDQNWEVINAAMTAINSHVVRDLARDLPLLEPDAVIVYLGNNEVVGPFGPGSAFGAQAPSLRRIRTSLFLQRSRIGQVIAGWKQSGQPAQEWQGMEMFLEQRFAQDDPRLEPMYSAFANNLSAILQAIEGAGADPLLCTVAVNLEQCAPFAPPEGSTSFASGDFQAARDEDRLRFRADSRINQIIRDVANTLPQVALVDIERDISTAGLMLDHVHFTFDGNYQVASALFRQLQTSAAAPPDREACGSALTYTPWEQKSIAETMLRRKQKPPFTYQQAHETEIETLREQLESLIGQVDTAPSIPPTDWNGAFRFGLRSVEHGHYKAAAGALRSVADQLPHRSEPAFHLLKAEAASGRLSSLSNRFTRIEPRPDPVDFYFRAGFEMMKDGNAAAAILLFQTTLQHDPNHPETLNSLGGAQLSLGDVESARTNLERAVALRPQYPEALNNLGSLAARSGRLDEAIDRFNRAVHLRPSYGSALHNLARAHFVRAQQNAQANRAVEAIQDYRRAIELRPLWVEPRVPLAMMLIQHPDSAVRDPEEALIHATAACASTKRSEPGPLAALAASLAAADRIEESRATAQEALNLPEVLDDQNLRAFLRHLASSPPKANSDQHQ